MVFQGIATVHDFAVSKGSWLIDVSSQFLSALFLKWWDYYHEVSMFLRKKSLRYMVCFEKATINRVILSYFFTFCLQGTVCAVAY